MRHKTLPIRSGLEFVSGGRSDAECCGLGAAAAAAAARLNVINYGTKAAFMYVMFDMPACRPANRPHSSLFFSLSAPLAHVPALAGRGYHLLLSLHKWLTTAQGGAAVQQHHPQHVDLATGGRPGERMSHICCCFPFPFPILFSFFFPAPPACVCVAWRSHGRWSMKMVSKNGRRSRYVIAAPPATENSNRNIPRPTPPYLPLPLIPSFAPIAPIDD